MYMQGVMHCVDTSPKMVHKFSSCRNMQLSFCTRSAQLMLCCETCPKTKMDVLLGKDSARDSQRISKAHGKCVSIEP